MRYRTSHCVDEVHVEFIPKARERVACTRVLEGDKCVETRLPSFP